MHEKTEELLIEMAERLVDELPPGATLRMASKDEQAAIEADRLGIKPADFDHTILTFRTVGGDEKKVFCVIVLERGATDV